MARITLQHEVVRRSGATKVERYEYASIEDAYRAADMAVAFTTANTWHQEVIDLDTGQRSARDLDTIWAPAG